MTLHLQYLVGIPGSIPLRFPIDGTYEWKRSGSHSLSFRLVIFLPTAVPPLRHGVTRLRARRGSTRRSLAQPRYGSAWLGMARRGLAWLDARRGARHRLSRGLELGTAFGWRDAARIYHRAQQERGYYASAHTYLPRSEETRRFCARESKREKERGKPSGKERWREVAVERGNEM